VNHLLVRAFGPDEWDELAAHFTRRPKVMEASVPERWRYLIERNPHATTHRPGRLWLALWGESLVGWICGVPASITNGVHTLSAIWGIDLHVRPEVRTRGIGRALLSHWRDQADVALGLGITEKALRLEKGLGWLHRPLRARYLLPLTSKGMLFAALARHGAPPMRRPRRSREGAALKVSTVAPRLPEDWDARVMNPRSWHVRRDPDYIRWRFGPLFFPHPIFLWIGSEDAPEALAVGRRDRTSRRDKLWIYELSTPNDQVMPSFVDLLIDWADGEGIDVIEGRFTDPRVIEWIRAAGFIRGRRVEHWIVHAHAERASGWDSRSLLEAPWSLTLTDSGNLDGEPPS